MAGVGQALRGIGKAYKKFKTRHGPKPGPENKFKYQGRDPTGEGMFEFVDRHAAKEAHEAGKKAPLPTGKITKRGIQIGAASIPGSYAYGKWKRHLKDKKKKKDKKAAGGRIGFKRAGPVTKADLARRDLWTKRELKRRGKVGQRKSRWDIKGGISGHPLNPLRIHAEAKATDWSSMRKDVYGRTRDALKKSRDPKVKRVAEGFQKMDYRDADKGTQFENRNEPKLKKQIHRMRGDTRPSGRVGAKTGGRIGFQKGNKVFTVTETKKGKPHWTREGQDASIKRKFQRKSDAYHKELKEKKREQYYKKHGRPGEFEAAARKQSESRNRRTHLGVIRNKGGKV